MLQSVPPNPSILADIRQVTNQEQNNRLTRRQITQSLLVTMLIIFIKNKRKQGNLTLSVVAPLICSKNGMSNGYMYLGDYWTKSTEQNVQNVKK